MPFQLCLDILASPCRACERLVLAVNAAVETFLSDQMPVRDYDLGSQASAEVFEAEAISRKASSGYWRWRSVSGCS